jgi:CRP/FNR family transcriptional regulator, cyclic AMP receptor protein
MDAAKLTQIALFEGLSDAQLKQIGGWADEIDVDTGYHLIRRDGFGYEFFAIIDGTAEVMDGERHLADLSAGDFFGEMALLDGGPRTATVTATTDVTLFVLTEWVYRGLLAEHATIAVHTLETMAARLRRATKTATT